MFALGIRHVGKKTAKILAQKYGTIDNLTKSTYEELFSINDIGETIAKSVSDWFREEKNVETINKLKSYNLNMDYLGPQIIVQEDFQDKTFVLTGTLTEYSRDEASELISNRGGKVTNSVTKKTDVVIVGENPGSKFTKAQEFGIAIWDEEKFKNKLEGI